jgi:hypothetical protein
VARGSNMREHFWVLIAEAPLQALVHIRRLICEAGRGGGWGLAPLLGASRAGCWPLALWWAFGPSKLLRERLGGAGARGELASGKPRPLNTDPQDEGFQGEERGEPGQARTFMH